MVKAVQRGRFSVYVDDEAGESHHRPHCHVRWADGHASVTLPDFTVLRGPLLATAARDELDDHIDDLRAAWNRLNPRSLNYSGLPSS